MPRIAAMKGSALRRQFSSDHSWRLALIIVFLAALALRLYALNWDHGTNLHPDELFVARIVLIDRIHLDWPPDLGQLLDPARSGLNPRSADPLTGEYREFPYGALPLWVTDAFALILSRLSEVNWNSGERAYLVGRALSALLSALTVIPVAAIGVATGGRTVGLLAALFIALAPMSIQLAHFFTTDSWLTFFVAFALLASIRAATLGGPRRFAVAGALMGLAMATKGSVFTLCIPIVTAAAIQTFRSAAWRKPSTAWATVPRNLMSAGLAAALSFLTFEPYALVRPQVYIQSLRKQAEIVSGSFDVPFTRVYAGTTPFIYQIEQLIRWGYGPVGGLLAVGGVLLIALLATRTRSVPALILMSWIVPYGIVLGAADAKFLRYLEPLGPVFAVGAALLLVKGRDALGSWRFVPASKAVVPAAMLLSVLWTGAFVSIYAHENTRITATKWIYGSIPPGSTLTSEYWDDALPRALAYSFSPPAFGYGSVVLDLYRDLPPVQASEALYQGIDRADVVVQSSHRVEAAVRAAPWRYRVQERFYDELERGRLGFEAVANFARPAAILGFPFDDQDADESFINYDHPQVAIYERTGPLSRSVFDDAMSWATHQPWFPVRAAPERTLLLDGPVGENPSVNDARWSEGLSSSTIGAISLWVLLLVVLSLVGAPIARLAFRSFPDRGWGLARTLGLVVAAYPVWLGASLHLFRFRAVWVVVALAIVAAAGWLLIRKEHSFGAAAPKSRAWFSAEAVFWIVFGLFLAFRLALPDGWHPIWGGEKPMEFALINAIGRSAYFPPYDPWYADGYVNYYYYGFYLMSFLIKATGIPAEYAFNLALPTVMGMLASGGFSVGAALTRGVTRSTRLALAGGWLSALALCIMGNLSAVRGFFSRPPLPFDPFIFWTWNGSRAVENAITEFPYFSGLYADLHSHVVALPLTVVVIALALATATSDLGCSLQKRFRIQRDAAVRIILLALFLGTLIATNAWDVPVYVMLSVTAIVMATRRVTPIKRRIVLFVVFGSMMVVGGWVLFLPFHQHFVPLFSQVAFVRDPTDLLQFLTHFGGLVAICAVGLTTLLLSPGMRSGTGLTWPLLAALAAIAGVLLSTSSDQGYWRLLGAALICLALAGPPLIAAWVRASPAVGDAHAVSLMSRGAIIAASVGVPFCIFSNRSVLGLMIGLGTAAGVGWLILRREPDRFLCLLLAAAFFTAAGVEIVVIADDLIGTAAYRMNTVFKFYNQIWVLLGLAAAVLTILMVKELLARRPITHVTDSGWNSRFTWSRVGVAISAVVLIGSLFYPALATAPRLAQKFNPGTVPGTLSALGWMQEGTVPVLDGTGVDDIGFRGDAAAIAWLQENVSGTPVVAEASIGPYRCNGSRISAATGLPTIIGWERHEQQQRYPELLPERVQDVRTLYTTPDVAEKLSILSKYNVEYIVVGDIERRYPIANNECSPTGSTAGIAAFESMVGDRLKVAFSEAGTTIYQVVPVGSSA